MPGTSIDQTASEQLRAHARVIVVEDNFSKAHGLEHLLAAAGCAVVGLAGNVEAALDLVAKSTFDLALLDIDLRGQRVTPVADTVRKRKRPLIFLSGYGDGDVLPKHLRGLPRLEKPIDPGELFQAIELALTAPPTGRL